MLTRTIIKKAQQYSYRNYLQLNASSHPDGFISPKDWINVWNMHKYELLTQSPQQNHTITHIQPAPTANQNAG